MIHYLLNFSSIQMSQVDSHSLIGEMVESTTASEAITLILLLRFENLQDFLLDRRVI